MLVGWREITRDALVEKLSVLADVLIDEVLVEDLGIDEIDMRVGLVGEFLKALYHRLPADVDQRQLIFAVRDRLMRQYQLQPKYNGRDVL